MWKKYGTVGQHTEENIKRRVRIACWITKAIDAHSEYVTFIVFTQEQWLGERASMVRYTFIVCLIQIRYTTSERYMVR